MKFFFVCFALAVVVVLAETTNSPSFRPVQYDGKPTCAVDSPILTVFTDDLVGFPNGIPASVRCAYTCNGMKKTGSGNCTGFNYINQLGPSGQAQCQFFNCTTVCCYMINAAGCTYYQTGSFSLKRLLTGAVDLSRNCSFPFTFNGGLYYQCIPTGNASCKACLISSTMTMNPCSMEVIAFVAKNVTMNVSIASVATPVPLMTVNNWITVFSRVDSTFPTGLGASSYVDGFGDIRSNFWLGLEKIYRLTNSGTNGGNRYRLRFEVQQATTLAWYSEEYDWFYLDGSLLFYTFHSSTSGTGDAVDSVNDAFNPANGMAWAAPLSSWCAKTYGPFWYTTATRCSHLRMFGGSAAAGFQWEFVDLQSSRMMMKQSSR